MSKLDELLDNHSFSTSEVNTAPEKSEVRSRLDDLLEKGTKSSLIKDRYTTGSDLDDQLVLDYNEQNRTKASLEDFADRGGVVGRVKEFGQGLKEAVVDTFPEDLARMVQGDDVKLNDNGFWQGIIDEQIADRKGRVPSLQRLRGDKLNEALYQGPQSAATSMVTGVGGALVGGAAGTAVAPGLGTVIGSMAGSGLASGTAFYRMSKNRFLNQILERAKSENVNITEEQWEDVKAKYDSEASEYGMAEALPEAIGSAITAGIFKVGHAGLNIIKGGVKAATSGIGKNIATNLGKHAANLGEEVATELWTSLWQGNIEQRVGLREDAPTFKEFLKNEAAAVVVGALTQGGGAHLASAIDSTENKVAIKKWAKERKSVLDSDDKNFKQKSEILDEFISDPGSILSDNAINRFNRRDQLNSLYETQYNGQKIQEAHAKVLQSQDKLFEHFNISDPVIVEQYNNIDKTDAKARDKFLEDYVMNQNIQDIDISMGNPVDLNESDSSKEARLNQWKAQQDNTSNEVKATFDNDVENSIVEFSDEILQAQAIVGDKFQDYVNEYGDPNIAAEAILNDYYSQEQEVQGDVETFDDVVYPESTPTLLENDVIELATKAKSTTELYEQVRRGEFNLGEKYNNIAKDQGFAVAFEQLWKDHSENYKPQTTDNQVFETVDLDTKQPTLAMGWEKPATVAKPAVVKPTPVTTAKEVEQVAKEVDVNPTEAQKEAGNYKKAHINVNGLDVAIENPKGSERSGVDTSGKPWKVKMNNHYGYVKRTEGKDGDQVDVFLGDKLGSDKVFVIDQVNPDGSFDEHKVMMGFPNKAQARIAYLKNYSKGWKGLGSSTEMTNDEFKEWVKDGKRTKVPASKKSKPTVKPTKPAIKEAKVAKSAVKAVVKPVKAVAKPTVAKKTVSKIKPKMEKKDVQKPIKKTSEKKNKQDSKKITKDDKSDIQDGNGKADVKYSAEKKPSFRSEKSQYNRLELLQKAQPDAKVKKIDGGAEVTLPNGKTFKASFVENIPENLRATGSWLGSDNLMQLTGRAGQFVTDHEVYHMAEDLVVSNADVRYLRKHIGGAERRANAYAKWQRSERSKRPPITRTEKIFASIREFAIKIANALGLLESRKNIAKIYKSVEAGETISDNEVSDKAVFSEFDEAKSMMDKPKKMWDALKEARGMKDNNSKIDITKADLLLKNIFYYSEKVPALKEIFDISMNLSEDKHVNENKIFNDEAGNFLVSDVEKAFNNKDKAKAKILNDYIWRVDKEGSQVRIESKTTETLGEIETTYSVIGKDGKKQNKTYDNEKDALEAMFDIEKEHMKKEGFTDDEINAVKSIRAIGNSGFNFLRGNIENIAKQLEGVEGSKQTIVDIMRDVKEIGDKRSTYMPRLHDNKKYNLTAKKGDQKIIKSYDLKASRNIAATKFISEGYKVEKFVRTNPSERAYLDLNIIAMNDFLNNAIDNISDENKKTLKDFGLTGNLTTYVKKDGSKNKEFVLDGDIEAKWMTDAFKDLYGGRRADGKWHFADVSTTFESQLVDFLNTRLSGDVAPMQMLATQISKQLGDIINMRGLGQRRIKRNTDEYWEGFETDVVSAITRNGKAIAGGVAKRDMAREMTKVITGTKVSWEQYKSENPIDADLKGTDRREANFKLFNEFKKMKKESRIDSATQPNAFEEARNQMDHMLRNKDASERAVGMLRGLAAVKYLSSPASGVINLTAMATTVPAAMKHFAGIDLTKAPVLLARNAGKYVKYMVHNKTGKGKEFIGEDKWLFDEITKRGYDEDLVNKELISSMNNKVGRTVQNITEKLMLVFSVTERVNRASTIAASYFGIKENHKGEWNQVEQEKALKKAKSLSDHAHGVYGDANKPAWTRGSDIGSQTLNSSYMFKTFSHNYLQLLNKIGFKDKKALSWMIASQAILGGAGAMVGFNVLMKAIAAVTGVDDPEEEMYRYIAENTGERGERFARTGLAGLVGLNLKGSLSMSLGELPTTLEELAGAPYSAVKDIAAGSYKLATGDIMKGFEDLSPRLIASPLKAIREGQEGVTGRTNQPVFYGNELLKPDTFDTVLRMFGFNPAAVSEKKEKQWHERKVKSTYSKLRSDLYTRYRRAILSGSIDGILNVMRDMEGYNARLERGKYNYIPFITPKTLKAIKTNMENPNSTERKRFNRDERKAEKLIKE